MAPEVFTGTRYDEKVDVYSYATISDAPGAVVEWGGVVVRGGSLLCARSLS